MVKRNKKNLDDRVSPQEATLLGYKDVYEFVQFGIEMLTWNKVDLTDPKAVEYRIGEYFQMCINRNMKPAVTGLALALGMNQREISLIRNGKYKSQAMWSVIPEQTAELVRKAYDVLGFLWESYMLHGEIDKISGIFLGKALFNMSDEHKDDDAVVSLAQREDDAQIEAKYLMLNAEDHKMLDVAEKETEDVDA